MYQLVLYQNPVLKFYVYLSNLKRTATILFVVFYFIASTGVMVGQHLCMGRVQETSLFKNVEKQCGMSMEMHQDMKDCCDDEWSLEKVEADQQVSLSLELADADYNLLYDVPFNEIVAALITTEEVTMVQNTGPPDISEPDLFILYHSLKIPFVIQS